MNCPRCRGTRLEEHERDGIAVDACPGCRGVWLDRTELERIVLRAARDFEEGRIERYDFLPPQTIDGSKRRAVPRRRRWFEPFSDIFD